MSDDEVALLRKKLGRLIERVERVRDDLALGSARPERDRRHARDDLRAAVDEALKP